MALVPVPCPATVDGKPCTMLEGHPGPHRATPFVLPVPNICVGCGLTSAQEPTVVVRGDLRFRCADCAQQRPAIEQNGPALASGGTKADSGKLGTHLLPTRPLEAIARVLDFGARKYAEENWRAGISYSRIYGAVLRHMWAWWRGEDLDPESGLPHLAHAGCEVLFLLEYSLGREERRLQLDDRTARDAG